MAGGGAGAYASGRCAGEVSATTLGPPGGSVAPGAEVDDGEVILMRLIQVLAVGVGTCLLTVMPAFALVAVKLPTGP